MLLEIQVFGSAEWYDKVAPALDKLGFTIVTDLSWSDPETDGELMGFYYTYTGKNPMPLNDFVKNIKDLEEIINDGEAPYIRFAIVPDKRKDSKS
ncbi:MAG: hypothetical protein LWY06_02845 [Firmicutes bacterium]|nr:hypothetical protein [Bacillota bacterium]